MLGPRCLVLGNLLAVAIAVAFGNSLGSAFGLLTLWLGGNFLSLVLALAWHIAVPERMATSASAEHCEPHRSVAKVEACG